MSDRTSPTFQRQQDCLSHTRRCENLVSHKVRADLLEQVPLQDTAGLVNNAARCGPGLCLWRSGSDVQSSIMFTNANITSEIVWSNKLKCSRLSRKAFLPNSIFNVSTSSRYSYLNCFQYTLEAVKSFKLLGISGS